MVKKHWREAEELETRHRVGLYKLKESLRNNFREFAIHMFMMCRQHYQEEHSSDPPLKDSYAPDLKDLMTCELNPGEVYSILYTPVSPSPPQDEHNAKRNIGQPLNPKLPGERFCFTLGTQQRTLFSLHLLQGDIMDFCRPQAPSVTTRSTNSSSGTSNKLFPSSSPVPPIIIPSSAPAEERIFATAATLWSDALTALVLIIDPDLSYATAAARGFVEACDSTLELHFDEFGGPRGQLDTVAKGLTQGSDFRPGDLFITRHSNLSGVQVVFHLVGDSLSPSRSSTPQPPSDPPAAPTVMPSPELLTGFRNLLNVAGTNSIQTLVLPLFLSDSSRHQPTTAL